MVRLKRTPSLLRRSNVHGGVDRYQDETVKQIRPATSRFMGKSNFSSPLSEIKLAKKLTGAIMAIRSV